MRSALIVAVISAAVLGVGLLVHLGAKSAGGTIEALGVLGIVVAIGMAVSASGRIGPEKQQSCCGCSCLVLLLVLPAAALALGVAGGPHLALLALPAWIPVAWALDTAAVSLSRHAHFRRSAGYARRRSARRRQLRHSPSRVR